MDELKNNPQIIELLETLEENGMHKEKGEVSALVSYARTWRRRTWPGIGCHTGCVPGCLPCYTVHLSLRLSLIHI